MYRSFAIGLMTVSVIAAATSAVDAADFASRTKNQHLFDIVKDKEIINTVKKIMPEKDYKTWLKWAADGSSSPAEEKNGIVYARACKPHYCGVFESAIAFDHKGNVWTAITANERTDKFFGAPDSTIRMQLSVGK